MEFSMRQVYLTDGDLFYATYDDIHSVIAQGSTVLVHYRSGRSSTLFRFSFESEARAFIRRLKVIWWTPPRETRARKAARS